MVGIRRYLTKKKLPNLFFIFYGTLFFFFFFNLFVTYSKFTVFICAVEAPFFPAALISLHPSVRCLLREALCFGFHGYGGLAHVCLIWSGRDWAQVVCVSLPPPPPCFFKLCGFEVKEYLPMGRQK